MNRHWLTLVGALALGACVQPTYTRTVVYELDVSKIDSVTSVAVRGGDRPLTWDRDSAMQVLVKDSLYRAVITYNTGYLKTEVKFVVNGKWELENQDNRRVGFDMNRDTTVYRAVFDTPRR